MESLERAIQKHTSAHASAELGICNSGQIGVWEFALAKVACSQGPENVIRNRAKRASRSATKQRVRDWPADDGRPELRRSAYKRGVRVRSRQPALAESQDLARAGNKPVQDPSRCDSVSGPESTHAVPPWFQNAGVRGGRLRHERRQARGSRQVARRRRPGLPSSNRERIATWPQPRL